MIQILMAVYNNQPYLKEQLDSILSQIGPDFSLIIRDDCSTDDSLALLQEYQKKYPEKIKLFLAPKNEGAKKNFSSLAKLADADYIMFSDGDDVWLPGKIQKTFDEMKSFESKYGSHHPLLIHTDLKVVDSYLNSQSESFWHYSCLDPVEGISLNRLLVSNVITGCTIMINRKLLEKALPIPFESVMHDWWLGLVAATFGEIGYLSQPTILYRQHNKNVLGAENLRDYRIILKKCLSLLTREALNRTHNKIQKMYNQAEVFYKRYSAEMGGKKARVVQNFIRMSQVGGMQGAQLFFYNKFYKNTKLKTLLFLVLVFGKSNYLKKGVINGNRHL